MKIKKADIYFTGDIDQRISITLDNDTEYSFGQIAIAVQKYGNGQKLHSIYFREE